VKVQASVPASLALAVVLLVSSACESPLQSSPVPDGRYFGVLQALDRASMTIEFVPSEFFTGEAASAEAAKDGEEAPSGFYVRMGHRTETLPLATAASLKLLGWDADGNMVPSPVPPAEFPGATDAWALTAYYWFEVDGGKIVEVEAQYTP
jgi:hypothetical protein